MTIPPRHLALVAALAALQACVVSTDEFRPKTAAECGAGEKACGYKCVSVNDPATGCGDPASCAPVNLQTDGGNCGACNHFCQNACSFGACVPETIVRASDDPRGIVEKNGAIYWLEGAQQGRLVSWAPAMGAFDNAAPQVLASGLDPRAGAPSLRRIASSPSLPSLYVAGSTLAPAENLTIFAYDPTAATPLTRVCGVSAALSTVAVDGIAATPTDVYWAPSDLHDIERCPVAGAALPSSVSTGSTQPIRGLTASGTLVYYGYADGGGTIARTSGGTEQVVRTGVATVPHRIAVYEGTVTELFWESELSGDVRYLYLDGVHTPTLAFPGSGVASPADIAVDSGGVYWTDRSAGQVWEWRADGTFFPLANGVSPVGLATDATHVYWTDAGGFVMRVPK